MTENSETPEVSESQIAVHWREEEYYPPPEKFVAQANANDPAILERFTEDKFPDCFTEYADLLTWDKPWDTVLDTSTAPFWKWFVGGKLNASYNCVDRHAAADPDKTAVIWVPELEADETVEISYGELLRRVNEFAALLRDFAGLNTGDRVTLHMPMVPEAVVTMLACARLGVIHSQVFGGFSGNACGTRIADSGQPGSDHDGRLLPGRLDGRSQGKGRRGRCRGQAAGSGRRQGPGVAAQARRVPVPDADGRRPRLFRRRRHRRSTRESRSHRFHWTRRTRCS